MSIEKSGIRVFSLIRQYFFIKYRMESKMKTSRTLRLATLLLALLMTVSAFVSCGNTTDPTDETTPAPTAQTSEEQGTDTESLYDDEGFLKDKIPSTLKLNTTLTMLYWKDRENVEFFVDDETGETVQDSIHDRNLRVEDRLGVEFEYVGTAGNYEHQSNFLTEAKNAKAGGTDFDLYAAYSMTTAGLAYNGLCRNLLNFDIIDFSAPWWPDSLINEAKIGGKLFLASGDLSTNLLYMMYPLYFNKDLIANYNLEDPYALVKNNEWTFAKLFEMAAAAEADSTGSADAKIYGFTQSTQVHCDAWFYAAGLRTIDRDKNGDLILSELWGSQRAEQAATEVQQFLHQTYTSYKDSDKSFMNGNSIFSLERARYASQYLAEASFTYGIVPMPKFDKDQANYATPIGYPSTLYAISDSSKQADAAAAALECLCSEGHRTVTPALFDITMKTKYASDSDAGQMFDIIRATTSFEVGRIYTSQLDNYPYSIFRSYVASDSPSASYTTSYQSAVRPLNKSLKKLQEAFDKIEG